MIKHLCQPLQIGQMNLKNSIVMPPMVVQYATNEGYVTKRTQQYYEARAMGGVALVIVEATYVHPEGQIIPKELGISDDKFIPGLSELAQAIHKHGARAAIQLVHGGRIAIPTPDGVAPVGPSAIPAAGRGMPRELTNDEIAEIINYFTLAALRAKKAGFDGVEIHGAHGYLIAQFISQPSNRRNDAYGGSLPNRARLLTEVIEAVKEATGPDYPVWCRINGKEFDLETGVTLEEAKEVAYMAEEAGAVAINVSAIGSKSPVNLNAATFTPAVLADLAAGVKGKVTVPVIAVGKMTPEAGERILAEGKADLIAFGRALFADPELPNKVCGNHLEDIRPCILCLRCRDDLVDNTVVGVSCSVNAAMGKEGAHQIAPTEKPKKVLIVGGGPAGMEAARVAALRGHHVSLWEKKERLGGQLVVAAAAPHKDRIGSLTSYFTIQLEKFEVEVELGHEATAEMVMAFGPEVLVLATGARPVVPEIPGLKMSDTVDAVTVLEGKVEVGTRVVIIGGELVACEVAEYLVQKGRKVTLMRRGPEVAQKVGPNIRTPLLSRLKEKGVTMLTDVTYHQATAKGLVVTTKDGERRSIEADTIVLAAGAVPNQRLYQEIKDKVPTVHLVGDCVSPRTILDAITEGHQTGLTI
ncbi:FAD-dependent oxidoreductase [Chloroflexota bacterium]